MKKVILIAACLLSLTTVNAQAPTTVEKKPARELKNSTPEQRAQKHVDALASEITLTDDQKSKIYTLALAKANKSEEIRTKYKTAENKEAREAELKAVKKDFRSNVQALLTAEQLEKLKAVQKENKASGKHSALDQ